MRVLAAKRISKDSETSSALLRQDEELRSACVTGGHELVAMVEDATVSGAINLDQRPSLKRWLTLPNRDMWDALMVTTQDRISRDDLHWWAFVAWTLQHNKTLIVLDDPSLDLTTEDGRTIAGFKANSAAKYRKSVSEKRLKQTAYHRENDFWAGGTWPYGYQSFTIVHDGKPRHRLILDPYTSGKIREAAQLIIAGEKTVNAIANRWNDEGVLTPIDHQRHVNKINGRLDRSNKVRGHKWTQQNLRGILTSPATRGFAMHEGKTRYRDGEPVKWADPVLDDETWHTLQGVLDKRKTPRGRPQARPLKGILWCPCGGKKYYTLYRMRGYSYAYYKCRAPRAVCADSIGWPVEWVHQFIDELVLDTIGPLNEQTKTYIPGKDNGAEIADLRESIQNLSANLAALKGAAASATIDILNANSERLTELEKEPVVPARWKRENTGRTYQQVWDTAGDDWQAKTEILIRTELRVTLSGAPAHPVIEVAWPDELEQRLATPQ